MPRRVRWFTLVNSMPQRTGGPSLRDTSAYTHTCGLAHWTSLTTPVTVTLLLTSNIEKEWWPRTGIDATLTAMLKTRQVSCFMPCILHDQGGFTRASEPERRCKARALSPS